MREQEKMLDANTLVSAARKVLARHQNYSTNETILTFVVNIALTRGESQKKQKLSSVGSNTNDIALTCDKRNQVHLQKEKIHRFRRARTKDHKLCRTNGMLRIYFIIKRLASRFDLCPSRLQSRMICEGRNRRSSEVLPNSTMHNGKATKRTHKRTPPSH